jgi:membrane-associated phospholipid phosphatase
MDGHQTFYRALCEAYTSINWQPFAVLGVGLFFGDARRIDTLAAAWALGLALCILPFHFLPAQSLFAFHHLTEHGWPIHPGGSHPKVLEALRSGAMQGLSVDSVTGLVTIPSFHACAAVILACAFWPYRLLRWPMLALNVAMALAAIPVGSHYVVDIVVGAACGGLAYAGAHALARRGGLRTRGRALPDPAAVPA